MSIYYGQPATIDQAPTPPAPVNIASSTNASPTVITTSAAHGLHTGQAVIIAGHLLNTNADGIWIVTVTASDKFKISSFSGFPGTFINGNGSGVNTGTVQSLAFPGVTLPEDLVTDQDAASVNVPFEALLDMTAWLAYKALANATILKGGSWTLKLGSTGIIESGAEIDVTGNVQVKSTGTVEAEAGGNIIALANSHTYLVGDTMLSDPQRLTDADHTISAHDGQVVILATPTGTRTITVEQATDPPFNGQWIDFWLSVPSLGNSYNIKREGSANIIVQIIGDNGNGQAYQGHARIHFEGGVWRLTGGNGIVPGLDA